MSLNKLKLGVKLLLAPILILIMMLGLSTFSFINLNKITSGIDDINDIYRIKTQEAGAAYKAIQNKKITSNRFFNTFDKDDLKLFDIYNYELVAVLDALKLLSLSPQELKDLGHIEEANTAYNLAFYKLSANIIESGGVNNLTDDELANLDKQTNQLLLVSARFEAESWAQLSLEAKHIKLQANALSSSSLVVSAIALVVGLVIALFVSLSIKKSVLMLYTAMCEISQGEADLTQRLNVSGNDELSGLASAFNDFMDSIHSIVKEVKNSVLQIDMNASSSKALISSTVQKISTQSERTMSVAAAITELDSSAVQVAGLTNDAKQASQDATKNASQGNIVVDESISSMENIARDVNEATTIIQSLADNSAQIGSVSEVIKSIAEQTNLLALNAAIEAARAGEQGRGFAVVADEVRTLATRTHESTNEIQTIISSLQSNTESAVHVMESSQVAASNGVDHAKKAGISLEEIVLSNQTVTDLASQISHSTQEQSAVTSDVQLSINSIQILSEETVSDSQLIEKASQEIAIVSNNLNELVSRFKV